MKSLICWLSLATIAIGSSVPSPARAQSAIGTPGIVRIPLGGFHSTTIYTPSPDNVTTNVTTQIGVGDDRPTITGNYYGSTNRYPNQQPIVIYQQPSTYPRAILTRCVLKTLDDPERSIVAVDRYSGKPCD